MEDFLNYDVGTVFILSITAEGIATVTDLHSLPPSHLFHPFQLLPFLPRQKCIFLSVYMSYGWILAKFFFACLWTETESRSINTRKKKKKKKERGQFQAILTKQASSIKDLLYGFREIFSCGTRRVVPSGQDSSILPARVANRSAGFDSSCPLTEQTVQKIVFLPL